MAHIESQAAHYFAGRPENYLADFLRRRFGYQGGRSGPGLQYIDHETGRLKDEDKFYVVTKDAEGGPILEIHEIESPATPDVGESPATPQS